MKEISHLEPEQILNIIKQLPVFSTFDLTEQTGFSGHHARLFSYHTGEFLIQEGGNDHSLFILLVGAASVVKEGASIPLAMLKPGDLFGEMGFLLQQNRTTNVIVHPPAQTTDEPADLFLPECPSLLAQADPQATAMAILFDRAILQQQERGTRIRLKNQIIQCLMARVDAMHEQLARLTDHAPLLPIDAALDGALHQEDDLSPEQLETTQDRIVEQLVTFVEELNRQWVLAPSSSHG